MAITTSMFFVPIESTPVHVLYDIECYNFYHKFTCAFKQTLAYYLRGELTLFFLPLPRHGLLVSTSLAGLQLSWTTPVSHHILFKTQSRETAFKVNVLKTFYLLLFQISTRVRQAFSPALLTLISLWCYSTSSDWRSESEPFPVWLRWFDIIPSTERLPVRFQVRTHA